MTGPVCPKMGAPLHRDVRSLDLAYKGEHLTVDMPGWYGDQGTESIHTADDMKVSDRALTFLKARVEDLREPPYDPTARPCPVLPSLEADEATFRSAVEQGRASARAGRLVTLDKVETWIGEQVTSERTRADISGDAASNIARLIPRPEQK